MRLFFSVHPGWARSALIATFIVLCGVAQSPLSADETSRARHQWGRFSPGAWKRVRIQTETMDERGNVASSSTTESFTTLTDVNDDDYTLRIEVQVDVKGKRFSAQPQMIRQGYFGETDGQTVMVRKLGPASVLIGGQTIPCETQEVTIQAPNLRRQMTMQVSERAPFAVLKRDCRATDAEGKQVNYTTAVEVFALQMPQKVLSEIRDTSYVKTVHKQGKNTTITIELECLEVPGGVIAHSLREEDDKGRILRKSTLELVDFGPGSGNAEETTAAHRRIFNRGRTRSNDRGNRME
jgi:hypothetical protein